MELANRVTLQTFTITPVLPSTRSTQTLHAAYTAAKKVHRARIEKPKEFGGAHICMQCLGAEFRDDEAFKLLGTMGYRPNPTINPLRAADRVHRLVRSNCLILSNK
jgi:hypothetical protein